MKTTTMAARRKSSAWFLDSARDSGDEEDAGWGIANWLLSINIMFELDHVAIPTPDIPGATDYYVRAFGAKVLYQSSTWAFLQLGAGKLALVTPGQHPGHIALRVDAATLTERARLAGIDIDTHRDGTRGVYLTDPFGNVIELICYPDCTAVYETPAGATEGEPT